MNSVKGFELFRTHNFIMTADNVSYSLTFKTKFQDTYLRNNRHTGGKNLRCFPSCGPSHRELGFCGTSIEVQLKSSIGYLPQEEDIVMIAEIQPVGKESGAFRVNNITTPSELKKLIRTKKDSMNRYILGEETHRSVESKTAWGGPISIGHFTINRQLSAWHYGWKGRL